MGGQASQGGVGALGLGRTPQQSGRAAEAPTSPVLQRALLADECLTDAHHVVHKHWAAPLISKEIGGGLRRRGGGHAAMQFTSGLANQATERFQLEHVCIRRSTACAELHMLAPGGSSTT